MLTHHALRGRRVLGLGLTAAAHGAHVRGGLFLARPQLQSQRQVLSPCLTRTSHLLSEPSARAPCLCHPPSPRWCRPPRSPVGHLSPGFAVEQRDSPHKSPGPATALIRGGLIIVGPTDVLFYPRGDGPEAVNGRARGSAPHAGPEADLGGTRLLAVWGVVRVGRLGQGSVCLWGSGRQGVSGRGQAGHRKQSRHFQRI